MKINIRKRLKPFLIKILLRFKNFNAENTIILCSDPRGGSTWLMEILNNVTNSVINWEPLHIRKGVVPLDFNFGRRPSLLEDENIYIYRDLFEKILVMKSTSPWTLKFIGVKKLLFSKNVIVKFVRASQLLPYLTKNFQFKHKPIYLVRHPITTCISQLKTFEKISISEMIKKKDPSDIFKVPNCINNQRFVENEIYINSLNSILERQIALWCINNIHILNHKSCNNWVTIYYENLIKNPYNEVVNLVGILKLKIDYNFLKSYNFKKASASNFYDNFNTDPKIQLEHYLTILDEKYLNNIQKIFDYFDLKNYSAFSAYPINSNK